MSIIALGNTAPIEPVKVDDTTAVERIARPELGNQVTIFNVPDTLDVGQALLTVSQVFASHHSDAPPAWVESDDETIAAVLARQYGCPVGRPVDWVEGPSEVYSNQEIPAETQTITQADVAPISSVLPTPGASV